MTAAPQDEDCIILEDSGPKITLDLTKDGDTVVELVDDEIQIIDPTPPPKRRRVKRTFSSRIQTLNPKALAGHLVPKTTAMILAEQDNRELQRRLQEQAGELQKLREENRRKDRQLKEKEQEVQVLEQATCLSKCGVCWEPVSKQKDFKLTPCGHLFCKFCMQKTFNLKKSCPICRKQIKSIQSCKPYYGGA